MRTPACLVVLGVCVLIGAPALAQPAAAPARPAVVSQKTLDLLASFPLPDRPAQPGAPYVPHGTFASWTPLDRQMVAPMLARACFTLWAMAHDNPAVRFLPAAQPDQDEQALGADLCLAGHMPPDWPERASTIAAARQILDQAHALGAPYQLPAPLRR